MQQKFTKMYICFIGCRTTLDRTVRFLDKLRREDIIISASEGAKTKGNAQSSINRHA